MRASVLCLDQGFVDHFDGVEGLTAPVGLRCFDIGRLLGQSASPGGGIVVGRV